MSDKQWPDGLEKALDILKPIMAGSYAACAEARSRLWQRRDEVERLQRQLNDAQVALETAEREYDDCGKHMMVVWEELKAEVIKIPLADEGQGEGGSQDG